MKLSDLLCYGIDFEILRDAVFDTFAQCVVKLDKKTVTFIDNEKYLDVVIKNDTVAAVICNSTIADKIPNNKGVIVSAAPRYDFFCVYNRYMSSCPESISKTSIGEDFTCGINTSISPYGVSIGNHVTIGDNVVIKPHTQIGDNVTILSGCVIGEEGFEVKRKEDKTLFPVKHFGRTVIGNNTVLKSLVSIHRAVFDWDSTVVGDNCVIDSMTHIAHGAKIHNYILIGSNTSLCGNCEIKDAAYLGPNVCICNRVIVGEGAKVSIGSVVTQNVPDGETVTGNFAVNHEKWIKFVKEIAN